MIKTAKKMTSKKKCSFTKRSEDLQFLHLKKISVSFESNFQHLIFLFFYFLLISMQNGQLPFAKFCATKIKSILALCLTKGLAFHIIDAMHIC